MIARVWKYGGLAAVALLLAGFAVMAEPFDHWQHRKLFTSCGTCHVGAKGTGGPLFPAAADCATCHDGKVEKEVTYTPRTAPQPSNLKFAHDVHVRAYTKEKRVTADTAAACFQCHAYKGSTEFMRVKRALVGNCFDCHEIDAAHYDAPDTECATCHLPLSEARAIPEATIATWEAPRSHDAPDIQQNTNWIVFEPNDDILWRQIRRDVTAFLTVIWRSGALFGTTPEQAFFVKCDEETNPKEMRDLGYCITEIGMSPVKPAEFVVFRVSQKAD